MFYYLFGFNNFINVIISSLLIAFILFILIGIFFLIKNYHKNIWSLMKGFAKFLTKLLNVLLKLVKNKDFLLVIFGIFICLLVYIFEENINIFNINIDRLKLRINLSNNRELFNIFAQAHTTIVVLFTAIISLANSLYREKYYGISVFRYKAFINSKIANYKILPLLNIILVIPMFIFLKYDLFYAMIGVFLMTIVSIILMLMPIFTFKNSEEEIKEEIANYITIKFFKNPIRNKKVLRDLRKSVSSKAIGINYFDYEDEVALMQNIFIKIVGKNFRKSDDKIKIINIWTNEFSQVINTFLESDNNKNYLFALDNLNKSYGTYNNFITDEKGEFLLHEQTHSSFLKGLSSISTEDDFERLFDGIKWDFINQLFNAAKNDSDLSSVFSSRFYHYLSKSKNYKELTSEFKQNLWAGYIQNLRGDYKDFNSIFEKKLTIKNLLYILKAMVTDSYKYRYLKEVVVDQFINHRYVKEYYKLILLYIGAYVYYAGYKEPLIEDDIVKYYKKLLSELKLENKVREINENIMKFNLFIFKNISQWEIYPKNETMKTPILETSTNEFFINLLFYGRNYEILSEYIIDKPSFFKNENQSFYEIIKEINNIEKEEFENKLKDFNKDVLNNRGILNSNTKNHVLDKLYTEYKKRKLSQYTKTQIDEAIKEINNTLSEKLFKEIDNDTRLIPFKEVEKYKTREKKVEPYHFVDTHIYFKLSYLPRNIKEDFYNHIKEEVYDKVIDNVKVNRVSKKFIEKFISIDKKNNIDTDFLFFNNHLWQNKINHREYFSKFKNRAFIHNKQQGEMCLVCNLKFIGLSIDNLEVKIKKIGINYPGVEKIFRFNKKTQMYEVRFNEPCSLVRDLELTKKEVEDYLYMMYRQVTVKIKYSYNKSKSKEEIGYQVIQKKKGDV